jgi:haloalkane dehalogenase
MIPADETFDGTWPFKPKFFEGNGFHQHYVDEGQGDGIVLVHGEPTWGYLYRNFIPRLAMRGRVIVPDHMGFGKSETPQDRDYSIAEHCQNLEQLLLSLNLSNITLVVQDWGGAIGGSFAVQHPDLIKCLCVCNTLFPGSTPPAGAPSIQDHDWFKWVHTEQFEPTVSNLGSTALAVMKRIGFERTDHVDETWVRAYASPFPTAADCKGALQFPRNIANPKTAEYLGGLIGKHGLDAVKALPAMCVHGEADRAIPTEFAVGAFKDLWPEGPVVRLPGVGHFLQEDAPEAVTALIEQFIQICDASA